MKKLIAVAAAGALVAGLAGCSAPQTESQDDSSQSAETTATSSSDRKALEDVLKFTDRDKDPSYDEATATKIALSGSSAAVTGDGASADGSTVTITADGTYILSGNLDGQIVVNLPGDDDKAQVVLDGATIHNESGPAMLVEQADKVFLTLAEGSVNSLTDSANYALSGDDDPKAALYSKDDLTINGTGQLTVEGNYYHGIASKDDLVVTGGTIAVTCAEDAFHGKDAVKIGGGDITVNAGDDGFNSDYVMWMADGTVNVESCVEGFEAEKVIIDGGDSTIKASDDGVNASASDITETVGDTSMAGFDPTGDGAAEPPEMPDGQAMPERGDGTEPPELPEGEDFEGGPRGDMGGQMPPDGEQGMQRGDRGMEMNADGDSVQVAAEDGDREMRGGKGMGPGGGAEENADGEARGMGGNGGGRGMGGGQMVMPGASTECLIQINGGTLTVDAGGDGLDSNGSIEITGGTVLVSGSTNSADSGLDYEYSATVDGGNVIIIGAAGMAEDFTDGDQAHLMERASGQAGSTITVLDASGSELVSWTAPKSFQTVVASAPNCTSVKVS